MTKNESSRLRSEALESEVITILDALATAAVVLDENDVIVESSAIAPAVPLFGAGKVTHRGLLAEIRRVRETACIAETDHTIHDERAAVPLVLRTRVAPLAYGRVLVLVEDRTAALQLDATRRDFVINASHELKTPVGAIALLAETIHDNADDVHAVERFSIQLVKESTRLTKLVQEIISLSRLQDGNLPVVARPVVVLDAVSEAIDRVATNAAERSIAIECGPELDESILVSADLELLTSAVQNLLENAVRYSDPGGQVKVDVTVGDNVEISVTDTGIGIAPEDQERIFERFYRVDPARSRETGGTGLGLAIVKHIVTDMDGRVLLHSVPGQGATFTLVLPRLPEPEITKTDQLASV